MVTLAIPTHQSTPEDRAGLAVRAALRVFRDGVRAADWLVTPSPDLEGRAPLFMAKESPAGCVRVCDLLDGMAGEG